MKFWLLNPWDALQGEIGFERGQLLSTALAEAGHEVVWWQGGFSHAEKTVRSSRLEIRSLGPRQTVVLLPTRPYRSNVSVARIMNIAGYSARFTLASRRFARPDAIMVSGPIFFCEPTLLYLQRYRMIPVVYEFRDLWPETIINSATGPNRWLRWTMFSAFLLSRRALFRSCAGIIGLNRTYLDVAKREAGPRDDLLTAVAYPSPAAEKPNRPSPRIKPAGQVWVISSGTLGASHDHRTLLAAAAMLQSRQPKVRFIITGIGAFAEEVRLTISNQKLGNVDYLGALPKDEFRALLGECDIGLALYRSFSPVVFPTKIVDYLLAGLGVVTSVQGEGAEILSRAAAGLAVPAEDPAALADALEHCLAGPRRIADLKENAARLATDFTQAQQIGTIVEMLEEVAKRKRPVPAGPG